MAYEYADCSLLLLFIDNGICADGKLCLVKDALSLAEADYERFTRLGDVSWVYEYDRHLLYFEGDGVD